MAELWDGVGEQGRGFTAQMGDREMLMLRVIVKKLPARVRRAPGWGNKMLD